ncbi:amino acid ABC transporter substrate-binding protein [Garciella nitratireducens]|uniref:Amino acid ABC transporter substrate-binding protein, PAAT family n=1 Tax=Garciella nitratireducens DSM 15102 TaxID=1121911 RepID=A0A1T4M9Y5_9FIRM|nr:amino acid ABC transporter substrate-binding protein [Garciella nitratireducens]SJZ63752.1 amino acid ABC transporter substrate-binding protein, PAAT family [Garciella nitratireducens DSM 15102]
MNKKYIIFIILLSIISLLIFGCSSQKATQGSSTQNQQDQSLEKIKEKGKFIVGLDDTFPPMGFRDKNGEIVGFDIDLAKEVAKRMGVEVEFKPIDWAGKVLSLNSGDIDVIWNGLTVTPERKKQILFSKSYIISDQSIIVAADSDINSKSDFKGKIIAAQAGSSSYDLVTADQEIMAMIKGGQVKQYSKYTEALMDLSAGRIDAVIIDEAVGRYYMSQKPEEYKMLKDNFGSQEYSIGFRMQDQAFKNEIDKILAEMIEDGTAAKISEKWFGKDIIAK